MTKSKLFFSLASLASNLAPAAAATVAAAFVLGGCIPQDSQQTTASSSGVVASQFPGLSSAQTVGATKVKLTWPNSTISGTTHYNIYNTTMLSSPQRIKQVNFGTNSVTLTGLTNESLYSFRVRSANSADVEDTNTNDLQAIPYAGITGATVQSSSSAIVTFSDASNADDVEVNCTTALNPVPQNWEIPVDSVAVVPTQALLTGLSPGQTYTCTAQLNIGGFVDNNVITQTFTPMGTASQMVFATQPSSAPAGSPFAVQPIVRILDVNGNLVSAGPDATAQVSIVASPVAPTTIGTLRGTTTVTAVGGIATFNGLYMDEAGTDALVATKQDTTSQGSRGSPAISATSSNIVITAGGASATTSTISIAPTNAALTAPLTADGSTTYTVTITIKDQYGSPIQGATVQFASTDAQDILTQPTGPTNASGVATGTIATTYANMTKALDISSPAGLTTVQVTAPFVPGGVTQLVFTNQPVTTGAGTVMPSFSIALEDKYNNIVTSGPYASDTITVQTTQGAAIAGTPSVAAVNGIATFTNVSIGTIGTFTLTPSDPNNFTNKPSNSFNITAASPYQIAVIYPTPTPVPTPPATAGTQSVVSNNCSLPITIMLQDSGGNKSNALAQTSVNISGLGGATLYTSCTGSAVTLPLVFSIGASTKTVYLKDPKAEALTITGSDVANILHSGTLSLYSTPADIALSAAATSVVAGKCSQAITLLTDGYNQAAGPNFLAQSLTLTGIFGASSATVWSDPNCTLPVTSTAITYPVQTASPYGYKVYVKDNKSETLTLNVSDNAGVLTPISTNQTISVLASNINFTGPTSVVAGHCSAAFTITLKDAAGNAVPVPGSTAASLTINGLASSSTGNFYVGSCGTTPYNSTLQIPAGSSSIQVYFEDTKSETLALSLSDPNNLMANSQTINLGVSPSALSITSGVTTTPTTACAGPFSVNTLDSLGNLTPAIVPITVNLTGGGTAGTFFKDACVTQTTSLTFSAGDSSHIFYYIGQYPGSFTFQAADAAAVLTSGTYTLPVTAAAGFIGTSSNPQPAGNNYSNLTWFTGSGTTPLPPLVNPRQNGAMSIQTVYVESTGNYLYVADYQLHRVHKYDYVNHAYLGWIGFYITDQQNCGSGNGNLCVPQFQTISGSAVTTPSTATCSNTNPQTITPGWCLGGLSAFQNPAGGGMQDPRGITDDGTYLYVVQNTGCNGVSVGGNCSNYSGINRYVLATGAFAGWIGKIASTPTSNASGNPINCSGYSSGYTPGWCLGGSSGQGGVGNPLDGTGGLFNANAITYSSATQMLYVSMQGAIFQYSAATGAYQGYIGWMNTHGTSGATGCTTFSNRVTPGWCVGGTFTQQNAYTSPGGINNPLSLVIFNIGPTPYLYVLHSDQGGTITYYNLQTGAYQGMLATNHTWVGPKSITTDGTYLYVADGSRVIQVDPTTGTLDGWIGKVQVTPTSDPSHTGCTSLSPNANTLGWCLGGSSRFGIEQQAMPGPSTIAYDNAGNLIVGGGSGSNPGANYGGYASFVYDNYTFTDSTIRMFSATTGAFEGSLGFQSNQIKQWSNNTQDISQFMGYDDYSMAGPAGVYNDGTYLYIAEQKAGRVKKVNMQTGQTVGWLGAVATTPTGGATGCTSAAPFTVVTSWCLGAVPEPDFNWGADLAGTTVGIMFSPTGITGDGTYIYVTDWNLLRVLKFRASDGAYFGWIGGINTSNKPTANGSGGTGYTCAGASTYTPGWCQDGYPLGANSLAAGASWDGYFVQPAGITYASNGNLYVTDTWEHRVLAFSASTGQFLGWVGGVNPSYPPTSGCSTTTNGSGNLISGTGWCMGGESIGRNGPDKGGAFSFGYNRAGITTDNTYLFVANNGNGRIDAWSLAGQFLGGTDQNPYQYNNSFSNVGTTLATYTSGYAVMGLWTDGKNLYGTSELNNWTNATVIFKMSLGYTSTPGTLLISTMAGSPTTSGVMAGWKGAILGSTTGYPTGGDTGCAGASGVTPSTGWCKGGLGVWGLTLGGFMEATFMSGDTASGGFVYVTDEATGRLTRMPK